MGTSCRESPPPPLVWPWWYQVQTQHLWEKERTLKGQCGEQVTSVLGSSRALAALLESVHQGAGETTDWEGKARPASSYSPQERLGRDVPKPLCCTEPGRSCGAGLPQQTEPSEGDPGDIRKDLGS